MKAALLLFALCLVHSCTYDEYLEPSNQDINLQEGQTFYIEPGYYNDLTVAYISYVDQASTDYEYCDAYLEKVYNYGVICFYCNESAEIGTSHNVILEGSWPAQQYYPFKRVFVYEIVAPSE